MVKVSAIIPTYGRPDDLKNLLKKLNKQTFKDFEVIIVDSNEVNYDYHDKKYTYTLRVEKLLNCGCNLARNKGIKLAEASIIAFTDDDCIPDDNWLENSLKYFDGPNVVGIEGLIYSERKGNAIHRTPQILERKKIVHGRTANMFYKKEILEKVSGFDERFEVKISRGRIGYRGDTDIAWRIEKHGKIPFAKDVRVFHPVDKTTLKKELKNSIAFIFTSLLIKKHPDRIKDVIYLTLFPITFSVPLKLFWLSIGLVKDSIHTKKPYMSKIEVRILADIIKEINPKRCLEWGSGNSTRYFPRFLDDDSLWVSIEHNKHWYKIINKHVGDNVKISYIPSNDIFWSDKISDGSYEDFKDYINLPKSLGIKFDFILVDGRARTACLESAVDLLNEGGIVVLHDANRKYYHKAFKFYKYQILFLNKCRDAGGLWIGSNTIDVKKSIALDDYQKKWNKQRIKVS